MSNSKNFWYANMAGAVAGWVFILFGAASPFSGILYGLWVVVTLLWVIGHPLELAMAVPVAMKAGYSPAAAVVYTLVFGITWWIPVKMGVFKP